MYWLHPESESAGTCWPEEAEQLEQGAGGLDFVNYATWVAHRQKWGI